MADVITKQINIMVTQTGLGNISGQFTNAGKAVTKLDESTKKSSESVKKLQLALKAAAVGGALALGGALLKSIKSAADFETKISDVKTLLSKTPEVADELGDAILKMAGEFPQDAEELGASAYAVVSAGFTDAAKAAEVLRGSAKLATGGLGTMEQATNLMTVAMNAFAKEGLSSEQTGEILFKTVKNGITDVRRLSESFGKAAGNASAADIKFVDLQAATAALSAVTGKTSEAQNALAQAYIELTVEGGKLDKALQENGSSVGELNEMIQGTGSFVAGLELAKERMGVTDTELKNMFSSAEAGTAVFQLLTEANDTYATAMQDMIGPSKELDKAFEIQKATFNNQWKILKNKLNVAMIKLGSTILPPLKDAISSVADKAKKLYDKWIELDDETKETIEWVGKVTGLFIGLKTAIEGTSKALETLKAAFALTGTMGPFMIIVAIIAAQVLAVQKAFEKLPRPLAIAVGAMMGIAGGMFMVWERAGRLGQEIGQLKNFFKSFGGAVSSVFHTIQGVIRSIWDPLWRYVSTKVKIAISPILPHLKSIWGSIVGVFRWIKTSVSALWNALWNSIKSKVTSAWGKIKPIIDAIKGAMDKIGKVGGVISGAGGVLGKIIGRQFGGDVLAGQRYIVGESGPELFEAPVSGRIIPRIDQRMEAVTPQGPALTVIFRGDIYGFSDFKQTILRILDDNAVKARLGGK